MINIDKLAVRAMKSVLQSGSVCDLSVLELEVPITISMWYTGEFWNRTQMEEAASTYHCTSDGEDVSPGV